MAGFPATLFSLLLSENSGLRKEGPMTCISWKRESYHLKLENLHIPARPQKMVLPWNMTFMDKCICEPACCEFSSFKYILDPKWLKCVSWNTKYSAASYQIIVFISCCLIIPVLYLKTHWIKMILDGTWEIKYNCHWCKFSPSLTI